MSGENSANVEDRQTARKKPAWKSRLRELIGKPGFPLVGSNGPHLVLHACLFLAGVVSCYSGGAPKQENAQDRYEGIQNLSKIVEPICEKVIEGETKRVAIRGEVFRKINPEEVQAIEECVLLKGAVIDTARDKISRSPYRYDSSVYVDFRVFEKNGKKFLSISYPYGWYAADHSIVEVYRLQQSGSRLVPADKTEP